MLWLCALQVQLPSYVELLRALVTALAGSSAAADAFVKTALPCYDALVQPLQGQQPSGIHQADMVTGSSSCSSDGSSSSAWLANPVLISRLSFVVPLIPVACKASADQAAAASSSLPLLLLLVPHPVAQLSEAAHSAVAGLFALAAEGAIRTSTGQAEVMLTQQQQQDALQRTVEQAVPMYLQRSLEFLPGCGSFEGLVVGFNRIVRDLPVGSTMVLLVVKLVADRAVQLAEKAVSESNSGVQAQHQLPPSAESAAASSSASPAAAAAPAASKLFASKLFELLQLAVQAVDYQLLPTVLQLVGHAVLQAPLRLQQQWVSNMYNSCLAVDDYARKPALVAWIDGLARQALQSKQAVVADLL